MDRSIVGFIAGTALIVGIISGWFLRGWIDPKYHVIQADTTGVQVLFDSSAVRVAAELRVIVARMTVERDSLTIRARQTDAFFGTALGRLQRAKDLIDSLRGALDSSAAYDVAVEGDTVFITAAKAITDSGDVVDVTVTADVGLRYSFLTNELGASIEIAPIAIALPVRRTHEIQVRRENFIFWIEPTVAYQGMMVGGGGQLGIKNIGFGVLSIPDHRPVFVLSGRWGI
jgi:hypothetical protein